ncbi:hypothetical protein MKW98_032358 [Papaver atlanticum]|uniref:Uncharacterized protein n=1 Tax=Papaver atlanticum TaxID=357466 RepID=A0AAD4XDE7_9MAGN|nr:hypothetical protein MKW98_032358 [Papaver atlanticum]
MLSYRLLKKSVGDWYSGTRLTKLLDCAYLCDNSFYNLIPQNEGLAKLEIQKRPGKAAPNKGQERRALT